jgi:CRP/FNR family transcriptional regulator, anaerobic regulatory protein
MSHLADCTSAYSGYTQPISQTLKHLMAVPVLARVESDECKLLAGANWMVREIAKTCSLNSQGQDRKTVSVLVSGWAFRYQTLRNGKRQILDFVFAGALFGFGSGGTYPYGVETVTDCTVASLPHDQFRRLLAASPALAMQVVERISDSEMRAHDHMTSLGRHSARERIATLILELASRSSRKELGLNKYTIDLPVTQLMIGDALGLSNEHVCRVLGKLAKDRVIEVAHHTLKVLDPAALAREAGAEVNIPFPARNALPVAA